MCWILVKPYLEKSMEDFLNGSKGGRPRKNKNPGFEITETPVSFSPETNMKMKMNRENEVQQRPTAPPAACAPQKGAGGGMAALNSSLDNGDRDAATDEARRILDEARRIFLKRCNSARRGPPQKRPRLTLKRRRDKQWITRKKHGRS